MSEQALAAHVVAPFASLSDLRAEHAKLMRAARKKDAEGDIVARVRGFVDRAQATGCVLDAQNDRDSAQGVLDYWTAWLFSSPDAAALSATPAILAAFDPTNSRQLAPADDPYLGLRAFAESDAGKFLGREDAIATMLEKLRQHSVVFVVGPLGCGKTSLVLAGVVPRLKSRLLIETEKEPICAGVIPGTDPIGALVKAIQQIATVSLPGNWVEENRKRLERSPASLAQMVRSAAPGSSVIVVVDQFEELFTLCADATIREKFTEAIVSLVPDLESSNRAILIIRDDYAAAAQHLDALKSFATESACFSPPAPTGAELVRIIKSAADNVGLKFDEGIVEDLANEVSGDVASLPTLQFTLSKLWDRRRGNRITSEAYAEVGRPREALRRAAEEVYGALDGEEQSLVESVFLELIQPGLGEEVQRRRLRRDSLRQLNPDNPEQAIRIVDRFVDAGLIRKTPGIDPDDDRFEVAHEALVHDWPRLNAWLRAKRQDSEKKLQLITTAKLWQKSGNPGYLLQGDAIKEAAAFRDAAPQLRDLIAASERAAQQRWRWNTYGGLALTFIFGVLAAYAVMLYFTKTQVTRDLTNVSKNFDSSDVSIQKLSVDLEKANETIARQQQQIMDLQKRLQPRTNVSPPPTEPPPTNDGQTGYVWIGPEAQSNLAEPVSGAPVPPSSVKANERYKIIKTVVLRKEKPDENTYQQGPSLGVVPEGTALTATGPAIPFIRPSGTTQYWLPVKVGLSDKPNVYVQFSGISEEKAHQIGEDLQKRGYQILRVQASPDAKGMNEVEYYYSQDKAAAEKVASDVTQLLHQRGYKLSPTRIVDSTGKPGHPGALELWLDLPTSR
ncbi:MAG: hypothetical protein JO328_07075 [Hyphomicrobiales bacterium]|nr:hypothetical protein [Hyphomicrobiales bacterium]MBV8823363.1 hypothetical protein [Hyphomicrobiales bacterium]MBV9429565.1 hypothetical protein [Bradyrhizobiaceae bacterium]